MGVPRRTGLPGLSLADGAVDAGPAADGRGCVLAHPAASRIAAPATPAAMARQLATTLRVDAAARVRASSRRRMRP
jgi:hypothetical protein